MSRKRHNPKDVVGLDENLTPYELYQSKLMKSVIDSVFSERWGNSWDGYSFMFSGKDGELVEQRVNVIRLHSGQVEDYLVKNDSPVIYPVLLKLRDGTTEYGFKLVQSKSIRTGRRQLTSYYVTDGIMNPSNGKWEYPNSLHGPDYPCPEVQDRLSLFNGDDDCVAKKVLSWAQYNEIQTWLTVGRECFVRTATKRPETPISGIEKRIVQKPRYSSPPQGYESWQNVTPVFMTFVRTRYLKSVYVDETKNKDVAKLFRLSDLLMVTSRKLDENGEQIELWNSLDSTCHGII
jgi:hypothetical protein